MINIFFLIISILYSNISNIFHSAEHINHRRKNKIKDFFIIVGIMFIQSLKFQLYLVNILSNICFRIKYDESIDYYNHRKLTL